MIGIINLFVGSNPIMISNIAYSSPYKLNEESAKKGIDISSWQEGIDFSLIKDNYEFVILRGGFTGTGNGINHYKDSSFESFYAKTRELNIPTGAYYYSCANTYEKGVEEAKYLYENILLGKKFEYPIYLDVEEGKYQASNREGVTAAIKGFCDYLKERGYYAGVYANSNYFNNYINTGDLNGYEKWLAVWRNTKPEFKYGDYGIWQNSSSGSIGGYRVDTDYAYKDYPTFIKENGLNGYEIKEEVPEETNESELEVIIEEDTGQEELSDGEVEKTLDELFNEVMEGLWGNDIERKINLENAGYDYDIVQNKVNDELLNKKEQYYTIKRGDTLFGIASMFYGDGYKYNLISERNNIKNPNLIYPGDTIIIP